MTGTVFRYKNRLICLPMSQAQSCQLDKLFSAAFLSVVPFRDASPSNTCPWVIRFPLIQTCSLQEYHRPESPILDSEFRNDT